MSLSLPVSINPKPLSVSRLIVPSAICPIPQKVSATLPENTVFRLLRRKPAILAGGTDTINRQQAMARAKERIWSPWGPRIQHVSLQVSIRGGSSCSPVLTRAWQDGRFPWERAGWLLVCPSDNGRHCGARSLSVLDPRCTQIQDGWPLKETSGEANSHDIGSHRAASARDSDAPSSVSRRAGSYYETFSAG